MAKLPVRTVAVVDRLPQPFRLIDMTLGYIIEVCFDIIDRKQQDAVSSSCQQQVCLVKLCLTHLLANVSAAMQADNRRAQDWYQCMQCFSVLIF
jgi:hypothetical protein